MRLFTWNIEENQLANWKNEHESTEDDEIQGHCEKSIDFLYGINSRLENV